MSWFGKGFRKMGSWLRRHPDVLIGGMLEIAGSHKPLKSFGQLAKEIATTEVQADVQDAVLQEFNQSLTLDQMQLVQKAVDKTLKVLAHKIKEA